MRKRNLKHCYLLLLAIGWFAFVSVQAGSLEPPPGPVSPTRPPDTCYDDTGNHFVDCGDGTIKDTATGLYWLKDADCFSETWANANIKAAELAHGQCGLTDGSLPGDWRLPTLGCSSGMSCVLSGATGEFASILAPSCPPPSILNTAGTGCWSEGNPFSGVQSDFYWSASNFTSNPIRAWTVTLDPGAGPSVGGNDKTADVFVWPLRGGPGGGDGDVPPPCNCCASGNGVGCNCPPCEAVVCAADPFCCKSSWDSTCDGEAATMCTCCTDGCV